MKKILFVCVALTLTIESFKYLEDCSVAQVTREQGYYIFIMSKPTTSFEYLGTLKQGNWSTWSSSPKELLDHAIKKAKKEYPRADAIIFNDMEMHTADCIKFKQ